jgi:hypothetical protein
MLDISAILGVEGLIAFGLLVNLDPVETIYCQTLLLPSELGLGQNGVLELLLKTLLFLLGPKTRVSIRLDSNKTWLLIIMVLL